MGAIGENTYVKTLVETSNLKSIPPEFAFANTDTKGSYSDSLPVIDFSLLTSSDPDERSKTLHQLDTACRERRVFILVNHGIPETLLKAMIAASLDFFNLPDEEKRPYETESATGPLKTGPGYSIIANNQKGHQWRDFVRAYVHPEFYCPTQPQSLRDNVKEYSDKTRVVFRELMHALAENLGLEKSFVDQDLQLDSCFQVYAASYYPPCPQPDQVIGLPAHTDPGLLTFLIHNGVSGLQTEHNGEWFYITSPQNGIIVNVADHLEIFSNGRYKSDRHRVVVNSEVMRISVVMSHAAAPSAVVAPAPQLVGKEGGKLYQPMKFMEYFDTQQDKRYLEKSSLDSIKINQDHE